MKIIVSVTIHIALYPDYPLLFILEYPAQGTAIDQLQSSNYPYADLLDPD